MSDNKSNEEPKQDAESEVWSAIQAFEQILEAMPNDRASLEALSHAYEQIGDHTKAKDYTVRLGKVLIDERDNAAASQLLDKLKEYAADDPQANDLVVQIEKFSASASEIAPDAEATADAVDASSKGKAKSAGRTGFNMADELSFAWNLMEANELTQEEYASVVQDLTEMSSSDAEATVSVLHVLEARGFKTLPKIMGFVSRECSAPIISLASFDTPPAASTLLPMDFMVRRGAIVFETLGTNALVVVMNPYDKQLRKDVEAQCGKKCHFFISSPADFDSSLEKVSEILLEKIAAAAQDEEEAEE